MSQFDKPHLRIPLSYCDNHPYTPRGGGGGGNKSRFPVRDRQQHAQRLLQELEKAVAPQEKASRLQLALNLDGRIDGHYVEFRSHPDHPLELDPLDHNAATPSHTLLAVRTIPTDTAEMQAATVFVKTGKEKAIAKKIKTYLSQTLKNNQNPRNAPFCESTHSIHPASLQSLWTDALGKFPQDVIAPVWWEVWLRRTDGKEVQRLQELSADLGMICTDDPFYFRTCIVLNVKASVEQLEQCLILHDFLELRSVPETAKFFLDQEPHEEREWTDELLSRRTLALDDAPAVCILDTGITQNHHLLKDLTDSKDCHAYHAAWGTDENHTHSAKRGHGTEMAGIALYGDLVDVFDSSSSFTLRHRLESVKILCPTDSLPSTLYPATMRFAVETVTGVNPQRKRVFALAVSEAFTDDSIPNGRPSSWSGALDALSAGNYRQYCLPEPVQLSIFNDDLQSSLTPHLFVVAAGNASLPSLSSESGHHLETLPPHPEYLDREVIESPGQSWNALTIGAFTSKTTIRDDDLRHKRLISRTGELSPWSRTSVRYDSDWAIKPDVVFEGGNGQSLHGLRDQTDDLCLLTTHYKLDDRLYTNFWGTSAATALAAKFCAELIADFPTLQPETIRALVVHSARWTSAMKEQFNKVENSKAAKLLLLRRYGYGVPDLQRARRCAANEVTLIAENEIQATDKSTLGDIHFYELPWPKEVLEALAGVEVRLRVTLSYFIEPHATRQGDIKRYQYASHGLRFDIIPATDTVEQFRSRKNKQAPKVGYGERNDSTQWYLGSKQRNQGSIHSDVYTTTAGDLATQNIIAVYPVGGWWKELAETKNTSLNARYSLVVSLETDDESVDFWTPIKQHMDVQISTETIVVT